MQEEVKASLEAHPHVLLSRISPAVGDAIQIILIDNRSNLGRM